MTLTIPGEPQAKERPRMTRTGHTYTPKRTRDYEALIRQCYHEQAHGEKLEGPLHARITAYMKIPKSARKAEQKAMAQGKIRPVKRPDMDNIIKSALDGLNSLAFEDDKQVVSVQAEKWYSYTPRLEIQIENL